MMKAAIRSWLGRFERHETKREIEEQVCLHLDLLTQALRQQDMSAEEARKAALKRFGDVEQIKAQCVTISNRRHPLILLLKSVLVLLFIGGVVLRILSPELHFTHFADVSIAVAVLGRLLLYVRGLNPSTFLSIDDTSSPLRLNDGPQPVGAYDEKMFTPVERVIFDK